MLATLEGKQLVLPSWANYRVCEVAAVSTSNRSNLPHPGLWLRNRVEKVKRQQLQRTSPQVKMNLYSQNTSEYYIESAI